MAENKPVWRLLTPEVDEHLALIEQQNRGLISRFDRAECCPGVLIRMKASGRFAEAPGQHDPRMQSRITLRSTRRRPHHRARILPRAAGWVPTL